MTFSAFHSVIAFIAPGLLGRPYIVSLYEHQEFF
jgi:hypothetical protein